MKSMRNKDLRRRINYDNRELNYIVLKSLVDVSLLSKRKRDPFFRSLKRSVRYAERTRIVNRCVVTDRSRSVYKDFKLSRMKVREMANCGDLPGIKKSSW
jgi:small subunit ribosomal protein S14